MQSALERSVPRETIKKPRPGNSQLIRRRLVSVGRYALRGVSHPGRTQEIADLVTKRSRLRKAEVLSIGGTPTTNQACLLVDRFDVVECDTSVAAF
jgi:hypothetical protein